MNPTKMTIEGMPVEIDFATGEVTGQGADFLKFMVDNHIEENGYNAVQDNMTIMQIKDPYRDMTSLVYLLRSGGVKYEGPREMMSVPEAPYTKAHFTPGILV